MEPRNRASRYVVQHLNTRIFPDPEALAANLERVTRHLGAAARRRSAADPERRALDLVRTREGRSLHRDAAGRCWRAFPFVAGSRSLDAAGSAGQASRLAEAFGAFLADLSDLDPGALVEVLPGFHDLTGRLRALETAAGRDRSGRRSAPGGELERILAAGGRLLDAPELAPGALPSRVVHNDCKLNNLLVDAETGEPLCVIDLDTVMPGLALFDFGELVRTAVCAAPEDEPDPARVRPDLEMLRALAEGFVRGARGLLEPREVRALWLAGPRMALENAARFLTDHLEGDAYFPARRPGHNLDRARAQLALAERLLEREAELRALCEALAGTG